MAGVQRGGRGELNASAKRDRWDLVPNDRNIIPFILLPIADEQNGRNVVYSEFLTGNPTRPPAPVAAGFWLKKLEWK